MAANLIEEICHEGTLPGKTLSRYRPVTRRYLLNSSSLLCDCNLRWLPQFALLTGLEGITAECAHPEALKGQPVAAIR